MAKDQENIHIFGDENDSIYLDALGSTLPTDLAAVTLADAGFLHESGLSLTRQADVQKFQPHQGAVVVRTKVTSSSKTIAFTLLEMNDTTRAIVDEVKASSTASGLTTETISGAVRVWVGCSVVDLIDGTYMERLVIPRFEVTVTGEESWSKSDLRAWACQGEIIGDYTRLSGTRP